MSVISDGIKKDIKDLITSFYAKFNPEVEKYQHLEIISRSAVSIDDFYDGFVQAHAEIRTDNKNKVRYFIQKKFNKLNKISTIKLPEHDIINQMCTTTIDLYWDTMHHMYILAESCMSDTDQTVINTIASEITKYSQQLEEIAAAEAAEIERKEAQAKKHAELLEQRMDKIDMPDINSLLSNVTDPKMKKAMKQMAKQSGMDINGALKSALGENKEVASMITTLMQNYNNAEDKTFDVQNMSSIFGSIIPEIDHTCQVNIILANKIYQDLLYVYEKKDETFPIIDQRIINTANKYMGLVKNGSLKVEELIACLWKVANDDEKQKYVVAMEKETITAPTIKTLINKFVPRQMLRQVPMDINGIVDTIFDGNFADLTSLFDMAKTYMANQSEEPEEVKLTEDQTLELEAYYDKMMSLGEKDTSSGDVPSSSSKKKVEGKSSPDDVSTSKKKGKRSKK